MVTAGPAVSSQGLAGNGAAHGHRGHHSASVTVFVCHKWAIKIVPSLVCTCSNVLAYGLLSPLFVILLLLLRHHFHGVRQTALCPGRKGMSLRQGPPFSSFSVSLRMCSHQTGGWAKHQQTPAEGAVGAVLCQLEEWHLFRIPWVRAALPKWEQGCHLLLVLVHVTFSVCCRVLCNSQQLEVFPAVMTSALGRHCLFVEKIRGGI